MANYIECCRYVSNVTLTEEGMFIQGDVPTNVQGTAELDLEVVHEVHMAAPNGEVMVLRFNVPPVYENSGTPGARVEKQWSDPAIVADTANVFVKKETNPSGNGIVTTESSNRPTTSLDTFDTDWKETADAFKNFTGYL